MIDVSAKIDPTYISGCFCERPTLAQGKPFRTQPRFNFRQQAEAYARENGLIIEQYSGKNKVALAVMPFACRHNPAQIIRLSWTLTH